MWGCRYGVVEIRCLSCSALIFPQNQNGLSCDTHGELCLMHSKTRISWYQSVSQICCMLWRLSCVILSVLYIWIWSKILHWQFAACIRDSFVFFLAVRLFEWCEWVNVVVINYLVAQSIAPPVGMRMVGPTCVMFQYCSFFDFHELHFHQHV